MKTLIHRNIGWSNYSNDLNSKANHLQKLGTIMDVYSLSITMIICIIKMYKKNLKDAKHNVKRAYVSRLINAWNVGDTKNF